MEGYMKIVRICSIGLYAQQYKAFVVQNLTAPVSYEGALEAMRKKGMLYPSSYGAQMKTLGIESHDIVPDFPFLQNLWKYQYGSRDGTNIFLEQIQHYKPDIIYFQELDVLPHALRKTLKQKFPFVKVITGFKGFPPRIYSDYSDLDHIFISYPYFQKTWEQVGVSVTLLPHCFDPGTADSTDIAQNSARPIDFSFVGSTGYGNQSQQGRYLDLLYMLEKTSLEIWGKEQEVRRGYLGLKSVAIGMASVIPHALLEYIRTHISKHSSSIDLFMRDTILVKKGTIPVFDWFLWKKPIHSLYPERFHNPVFGHDYLSVLSSSRISLNRHTDELWEGGNIRTFEITGMGSCLLVDDRENIDSLFDEDEIVTYTSREDCVEKVNYLLNHNFEREVIANRGALRVRKNHMTIHRCEVIARALLGIV